MKELLVILGAVILGVFISMAVIMGDNASSLKTGTKNMGVESKSQIDALNATTPGGTSTTTW